MKEKCLNSEFLKGVAVGSLFALAGTQVTSNIGLASLLAVSGLLVWRSSLRREKHLPNRRDPS